MTLSLRNFSYSSSSIHLQFCIRVSTKKSMPASHAEFSLLRHTPDYFISRDQLCKNLKDFLCPYDRTVHLWTAIPSSFVHFERRVCANDSCFQKNSKTWRQEFSKSGNNVLEEHHVYSSRVIRYITSLLNRHNISGLLVYGALHYIPKRCRRISVTAGFRREVDCALLGYYAANSGNSIPTFRDLCGNSLPMFLAKLSVPYSRVKQYKKSFLDCLALQNGSDRFSRNVCNKLPI